MQNEATVDEEQTAMIIRRTQHHVWRFISRTITLIHRSSSHSRYERQDLYQHSRNQVEIEIWWWAIYVNRTSRLTSVECRRCVGPVVVPGQTVNSGHGYGTLLIHLKKKYCLDKTTGIVSNRPPACRLPSRGQNWTEQIWDVCWRRVGNSRSQVKRPLSLLFWNSIQWFC